MGCGLEHLGEALECVWRVLEAPGEYFRGRRRHLTATWPEKGTTEPKGVALFFAPPDKRNNGSKWEPKGAKSKRNGGNM